jgi:hypothetical protein
VRVPLSLTEGVAEGAPDPLADAESVLLTEGGSAPTVLVRERDSDALRDSEGDTESDTEAEADGLADREDDSYALADGVTDEDSYADADAETEAEV